MKKLFLLVCLLILGISNAQSNLDLSYYITEGNLNPAIPTPESIIGHPVGKWHITHDKLVQYMYALAESSDRISIENRGKTYEDRPLLLLTITSPKNHSNIESIQQKHLSLTEKGSENIDLVTMPIVVYQGFSIHGNEPSGSNAALIAAYYLAASQSKETEKLLDNTVILFDPAFNPDGLQRFAYWANTNKNKNLTSDSNDREYYEVWPRGRTNHYWFDMNRDWLPVQLPESRARIKTYHNWYPNILTDHHEMGTSSTFFFQPGIPSRTHPLTPKMNQELTQSIGEFHAKALDKLGSLYYTEEDYDDFYYGKGSTFPDINGGIGILFEQASSRGHIQESDNGLLTFPFTIRNQFTAAMSTLEAAKNMRIQILNYQRDFYSNAREESKKQNAIVFGDTKDAAKTFHLAEILQRHKIKFHELKKDVTLNEKKFKKGFSYVVPTNQKNARLIRAMFERRTEFQDSLFYDISAWTFPLAFNLDFAENVASNHIGSEVTNLSFRKGSVTNKNDYAYVMEWHEYYTPKLLNSLLTKNIRVKVALQQFSSETKNYDYGTILIPVQNQELNSEELYILLNKLAVENHIQIDGINTGLNKGVDFGSRTFKTVKKPEIALIVGTGVSSYDAGEIWHLLDQRFDITITKIDTQHLSSTNLSRYNTIIIPSSSSFNESATKNLKDWASDGGAIIGFRNTLKWFNSKEFAKIEFKKSSQVAKNISFEQKRDFHGAQNIGGAIFEVKLDRSHPINFGYKNDNIAIFRNTSLFMKADKNSYNNPIQYTENPLLSGYISKPKLDSLKNTVPFKISRLNNGKVISFTDNTNFRAFWYGTNKLMMNAIFFRDEL